MNRRVLGPLPAPSFPYYFSSVTPKRGLVSSLVFVLGLTFLKVELALFHHTFNPQSTEEMDRAATLCQGQGFS